MMKMSDLQTFLGEKPYKFVPIVSNCKRNNTTKHNSPDINLYSGKLNIKIEVLSPIHIGNGQVEFSNGRFIKPTIRNNGIVAIPGSSLKGVVRSVAEAVSNSCPPDVPDKKLKDIFTEFLPTNNKLKCNSAKKLCPTCSIFGFAAGNYSYKSKVEFGEYKANENIKILSIILPEQKSPFENYPKPEQHDVFNDKHELFRNNKNNVNPKKAIYGNERLYYCQACSDDNRDCNTCTKENYFKNIKIAGHSRPMKFRGRKFYYSGDISKNISIIDNRSIYEFVDKGAIFQGDISFRNLTQEELGLLCFSLGLGELKMLKLGFGKKYGYGQISVSLNNVEDFFVRYTGEAKINKNIIIDLANQYTNNLDPDVKEAMELLTKIWAVPHG